jgi:hypothetical protein
MLITCNLINYFLGEVIVISTGYFFSVIFTTLVTGQARQRAFARNVEILLIFSGSCIPTNESLFIWLTLPTIIKYCTAHWEAMQLNGLMFLIMYVSIETPDPWKYVMCTVYDFLDSQFQFCLVLSVHSPHWSRW